MNLRAIYDKINCLCSALFGSVDVKSITVSVADGLVRLGDSTGERPIRSIRVDLTACAVNDLAQVTLVGASTLEVINVIRYGTDYQDATFIAPYGAFSPNSSVQAIDSPITVLLIY